MIKVIVPVLRLLAEKKTPTSIRARPSFVALKINLEITLVLFFANLMKHFQLLFLKDILLSFDPTLTNADIIFYTFVCYICFFAGNFTGSIILYNVLGTKLSPRMAVGIAMILMAAFTFFQGLSKSLTEFLIFRYILGNIMMFEKLGPAFIRDQIASDYKNPSFLLNATAYTLGSLAGPLVGLLIYTSYSTNEAAMQVLTSMLIMVFALYATVFFVLPEPKKAKETKKGEVERINFIKRTSLVNTSWKMAIGSALWDNKVSSALITIMLINSTCFHLSLILTTLYLTTTATPENRAIHQNMIAKGNVIASIGALITIFFFNKIKRNPKIYNGHMMKRITISAVCSILTPYLKDILYFFNVYNPFLILVFIFIKDMVCYYLYSAILIYLIDVSLFKIIRKRVRLFVILTKALLSCVVCCAILAWRWFQTTYSNWSFIQIDNLKMYFWMIGIFQFWTLTQFKYVRKVLDKSNMID